MAQAGGKLPHELPAALEAARSEIEKLFREPADGLWHSLAATVAHARPI